MISLISRSLNRYLISNKKHTKQVLNFDYLDFLKDFLFEILPIFFICL
jgi:hypothetical protein